MKFVNINDTLLNITTIVDSLVVNNANGSYLDWSDYVCIVIIVFGIFSVLVSIKVFLHPKLNDQVYKFLLVESVNDFVYLVFLAFYPVAYHPNLDHTLASRVYYYAIDYYLTSCMAVMNIFVELFLSAQRLSIVLNKSFLKNVSFKWATIGIACASLVYYAPILSLKTFVRVNGTANQYVLERSSFGQTTFGKLIMPMLSVIRAFLVSVCLSILNFVCLFRFRAYLKNKAKLKINAKNDFNSSVIKNVENSTINPNELAPSTANYNNNNNNNLSARETSRVEKKPKHFKAKRNLTRMVISVSFLHSLGTLPWSTYIIMNNLFNLDASYVRYISNAAAILLYFFIACKIFIYYFFNRLYRNILNSQVRYFLFGV